MKSCPSTSRDPVCGADVVVETSTHHVDHHAMTFHFCSEQCRTRFIAVPELYTSAQRSADIRPIPKHRRLLLAAAGELNRLDAYARIAAMKGISSVSIDARQMRVTYDLRMVSVAQIETVATACGLVLKGGMHRWRRSLWHFFEMNELDNAAHAGTMACCSRPPGGGR
jgi:YHS domain-containing protein